MLRDRRPSTATLGGVSETTRRHWDGATYDRVANPQARWGTAVLERLALRGDETVLDCGCGSGRVTEQLLAALPRGRVIALDASASMLDQSRLRLAHGDERVSFVRADLLVLSPATLDGSAPVDAVFSSATFHWITDHPRLFANLAGVLRPGGQLSAQCGAQGNIDRLLEVARSVGLERSSAWEYASAETTSERLQAAGFENVRAWTHQEPTRFDDETDLAEFLETVCFGDAVAAMDEAERRALMLRVVAAMPEPVIDYVRLNMVATRAL
ncbi:MAG: 16S rRNA (cytosine(1402)-N(4))-methyltransferase [Candidatus Aeolococcus gillhamiae]|uniref:16S rRNA (Cytosine(1402)-N(4))-methyltransferase n=1 Tax=Candidatus Aeolococcus gillhamiae TaxID=3127015 RepID=A0A2W5ZBR6_9BACT|nr:MAG: 16S rRNA (cytosine(1402)-N(4))-methyltransferase [Candidatus Dormibacter sp. RRmetagenome_bin12]